MHVTVVVNPCAGRRGSARFNRAAVEALVSRVAACAGASADVLVTAGPGGASTCARAAVAAGADVVVAWGGDGTVNEVAAVVAGTDVALGIVPAGSGNGLALELRIPHRPTQALELAFARRLRPVDIGVAGVRPFVNVAGFGFDAHVARRFNASASGRGLVRYVRWTVSEIFRYRPRRYTVSWQGGRFDGEALFVVFANSRQYGNGAQVAPEARLDDGLLDLVAVRPTTPVRDLWRARRLFVGSLRRDPGVAYATVARATIVSEGLCGHVDGETLESADSLDVSIRPRGLQVCGRPAPARGGVPKGA